MKKLFRGGGPLVVGGLYVYVSTAVVFSAAAITGTPAQSPQIVTTVSYNGQEFLSSFNSARGETRLVLVFSPT